MKDFKEKEEDGGGDADDDSDGSWKKFKEAEEE